MPDVCSFYMDYLTHLSHWPYEMSTMIVHMWQVRKPRPAQGTWAQARTFTKRRSWKRSAPILSRTHKSQAFSASAHRKLLLPVIHDLHGAQAHDRWVLSWILLHDQLLIHLITLPRLAHMLPWSPWFLTLSQSLADPDPTQSPCWSLQVSPTLKCWRIWAWSSHLLSALSTHSLGGFLQAQGFKHYQ